MTPLMCSHLNLLVMPTVFYGREGNDTLRIIQTEKIYRV